MTKLIAKKIEDETKSEKIKKKIIGKKIPKTLVEVKDLPWWLRGLEHVSNSSRHSLEDLGSNPRWGLRD